MAFDAFPPQPSRKVDAEILREAAGIVRKYGYLRGLLTNGERYCAMGGIIKAARNHGIIDAYSYASNMNVASMAYFDDGNVLSNYNDSRLGLWGKGEAVARRLEAFAAKYEAAKIIPVSSIG